MFAVLELPVCRRRDLCALCFDELQRRQRAEGTRPAVFWRVRQRVGEHQPVLDLVTLRHLFDRLGEEPGERPAALRYFVALLLLRKRVLKMAEPASAAEAAADLLVFDPKAPTVPPVALVAPPLVEQSLAELKDELLRAAGAIDEAGETVD